MVMLVALYTSAWIEISIVPALKTTTLVALYTSAWIEISSSRIPDWLPFVALYTSAWIEIAPTFCPLSKLGSRTLHECVD